MTPENFCYWLKGYLKSCEEKGPGWLDKIQVSHIQENLEFALGGHKEVWTMKEIASLIRDYKCEYGINPLIENDESY